MADFSDVEAAILGGDVDGKLDLVLGAVQQRLLATAAALRWKLAHDGLEVTEDDLTVGEARKIERVTSRTWVTLDPFRSSDDCAAILAVCLHTRRNMPLADATVKVEALPMNDLVGCLSRYEAPTVPFDSSPPTSS